MELTTIKELYKSKEQYLDQKVTVGGWVRSIRDSKTFGFIVLNDGTFFEALQIVYHDKMDNFAEISKLNVGAAVIVLRRRRRSSLLRSRPIPWRWKERLRRIIRCRRRDTASNIFGRSHILGRGRTHFRQYSGYAR